MKRETWSGLFIATLLATTGALMAQSPSPSNSSAPQTPSSATPSATQAAVPQTPSANKVTVTGCLREAPAGATGTSGSASAAGATDAAGKPASPEGKYILAEAVPSSPASGTPTSTSKPQTYRLIANDSALTPHVGKKLELTGTLEGKDASASSDPQLRVESGNVLAGDCSSGAK